MKDVVTLQVIVYEKCPICGKNLRIYNQKSGSYYFGPRIVKCPKCGHLTRNEKGIELATLDYKRIKKYAREYCLEGNFGITLIFWMVITIALTSIPSVETYLHENQIPEGALALAVAVLCYGMIVLIKYIQFWKQIYPDSFKRMQDPEYTDMIQRWNKQHFGKTYNTKNSNNSNLDSTTDEFDGHINDTDRIKNSSDDSTNKGKNNPSNSRPSEINDLHIYEHIRALKELADDGILTEEEFEKKKTELLKKIN